MDSIAARVAALQAQMTAAVDAVGEAYAASLQEMAPVGTHYDADGTPRPGGALKASVRWVRTSATGGYVELAHQAIFVDQGTAPHVIRPRAAKALRFFSAGAGGTLIRRSVQHPGTKPQHLFQRAWDAPRVQTVIQGIPHLLVKRG